MAAGDVVVDITSAKAMKCAVFDGVDDHITITKNAFINKTGLFSVSLWFNIRELPAATVGLFSHSNNTNDRLGLVIHNGTGIISFGIYNGASYAFKKSSTVSASFNTWQHAVIIFDGSTLNLYVDGVLQTGTTQPSLDSTGASIGNSSTRTRPFNGSIADVRIFDKALTTTEITQLFNKEDVIRSLINKWDFMNDDYTDSVGSNDGTNNGSRIGIIDEDVAAAVKAARTTANDQYIMAPTANNQVITTVVEEA